MQFARRQRTFRSGLAPLVASVPIGLLLGFVGPFGTYPTFPTGTRYAFWTGLTIIGLAVALATDAALPDVKVGGKKLRSAAVVLLSAVPMTFVVAWTMTLVQPHRIYAPSRLFMLFWGVAAVQLIIAIVAAIAFPGVAHADPRPDEVPQPITFPASILTKIPASLRGEILALETEDHYLRVHTTLGSTLILMRMKDAVTLLHPELGAQVHRRWWVADAAVTEMRAAGQKIVLCLRNQQLVPVGRTFASKIRARFGSIEIKSQLP